MNQVENVHTQEADEILKTLKSSKEKGLTSGEAKLRLKQYGLNQLKEKRKKSPLAMLLDQFKETMVLILIIAAVISGFLGEEIETIAIAAIVILFALLGFIQEYRAEKAMAALKQLSAPLVRTIRDGVIREISSKQLAPGDIIIMEAGNIVPADVRIIETVNLKIQEATLTGESEAIDKKTHVVENPDAPLGDRVNMAYMGTTIARGRGKGVVVQTGMQTELGKIASMIQEVQAVRTPLQSRLDQLGKWLAVAGGLAALLILVLGLLKGESFSDMFLVGISVAVAVVPEGLPAVVTITLALGSQKMLKRNALIRKLPAVETLGSVTVICSDKTGTLTENKMSVTTIESAGESVKGFPNADGQYPDILRLNLLIGTMCNDAVVQKGKTLSMGDPTETALADAALIAGLNKNDLEKDLPRIGEIPFDSERMRMISVHNIKERFPLINLIADDPTSYVALAKGAVDSLLSVSTHIHTQNGVEPLSEEWIKRIKKSHDEMAAKGIRILGFAYRKLEEKDVNNLSGIEKNLVFAGLAGLIDPPRPAVKPAVARCKSAGIRPVMITGDYPLTAVAIAGELGIQETPQFLTSQDLGKMDEAELNQKVKEVNVFARVAPQDKLRIVTALQNQGEVVAMTGDGVNDSPALKKANIGVAMGITGTDVTKEASDMVLLDDNFATIVTSVEEGRSIFDNLLRFIKFSLGGNLGKVFIMLVAPFFGIVIALSPLQLLWLNLLTDGLMGLGLGVEPAEEDTMERPPRRSKDPILNKAAIIHVSWTGALIATISLLVGFLYHDPDFPDDPTWQTMIFATIGFTQIGHALGLRATGHSVFSVTSNKLFTIVFILTLILHLSVIYVPVINDFFDLTPLKWPDLALSFLLGSLLLVGVKIERRFFKPKFFS